MSQSTNNNQAQTTKNNNSGGGSNPRGNIYNSRINMPSKKSQKRKKSTGVLSSSIATSSNVAQIHQTLQLRPNLKNIYASASQSQGGASLKVKSSAQNNSNTHNYYPAPNQNAQATISDTHSVGPTSQKIFRRSGTNTSNPRGRKKVF